MAVSKKRQKRARAHHVLPQVYLREWADSRDAVSMMTRDGREVQTATQALGVLNDLYTLTAPDGTKDSSVEEKLLREWDGRGAEIHQRLLVAELRRHRIGVLVATPAARTAIARSRTVGFEPVVRSGRLVVLERDATNRRPGPG